MRVRAWLVLAALAGGAAAAEPRPELPPLALYPPDDAGPLPAGVAVSHPLACVRETVPIPTQVKDQSAWDGDGIVAPRPLGDVWAASELLVWWPKAQPVPPLTGPGTAVLLGGTALTTRPAAGGRFTAGAAVNDARTAGAELSYLVLNGHTGSSAAVSPGADAAVAAATFTRVVGWEVSGVGRLATDPAGWLDALAGYRYFQLGEGLDIDHTAGGPAPLRAADQFSAGTRFHGGQLGLRGGYTRGPLFLDYTGKVAVGQSVDVVRVGGESEAGFPDGRVASGGVLARPSNSGRFVRTGFAVLPEAAVKLGYRFRDTSRVYVGYDFLYLSSAVRPGDQIDRRAETAGAGRPLPTQYRTDFWVQGVLFGLEYRY